MIVLAHYRRDARLFLAGWDPCHVLERGADGSVEGFVGAVRLTPNNIRGARGSLLCPSCFSLRQQRARASATVGDWQGAFKEVMPDGDSYGARLR